MSTRNIFCPIQTGRSFQAENCLHCRYFETGSGNAMLGLHPQCLKQRAVAQKREWEHAFAEYRAGRTHTEQDNSLCL